MGALALMPKWAWVLIGAALLAATFYFVLDAYGDARYDAGKKDADAAWIAASNKLIDQAQKAGTKADEKAAVRAADFAAKQEDEKERIDAATKEGSSPFDVLFNSAE